MLRELKNAYIFRQLGLFGWRYGLIVGKRPCQPRWNSKRQREILSISTGRPCRLFSQEGRIYWRYEGRLFWEDEDLDETDVVALVRDRDRRQERKLERARATLAAEDVGMRRRELIPREVKLAVFQRDGGRCIECGSNFDIQYDHVIPFSMGGASTVENLQILCADCNRRKSDSL
jgi:hypothetical protein